MCDRMQAQPHRSGVQYDGCNRSHSRRLHSGPDNRNIHAKAALHVVCTAIGRHLSPFNFEGRGSAVTGIDGLTDGHLSLNGVDESILNQAA
jgi:hypothetical protein